MEPIKDNSANGESFESFERSIIKYEFKPNVEKLNLNIYMVDFKRSNDQCEQCCTKQEHST